MNDLRLAVLIDADNVPYSNVKEMLEEIAKNGTPTIKRIYADWTKPTVAGWKNILLQNAITPVQQYSYTQEKWKDFASSQVTATLHDWQPD
jgi:hypothetical protein